MNALDVRQRADAEKATLGFWVYLMTDCVLFASLFATFIVLRSGTFGGPAGNELFDLNFVLIETFLLLTSSFTAGLMLIATYQGNKNTNLGLLGVTAALGAAFLGMELYEFGMLVAEGASWQRSAFLSAFFTLVGTHGLHIAVGLLWAGVIGWRVWRRGLDARSVKRLGLFGLFWHFLDIVWIFIFTVVYLIGAVS